MKPSDGLGVWVFGAEGPELRTCLGLRVPCGRIVESNIKRRQQAWQCALIRIESGGRPTGPTRKEDSVKGSYIKPYTLNRMGSQRLGCPEDLPDCCPFCFSLKWQFPLTRGPQYKLQNTKKPCYREPRRYHSFWETPNWNSIRMLHL